MDFDAVVTILGFYEAVNSEFKASLVLNPY
jgi:hypothetical protein